ncbi:MAG: sulfite exporter TauE/SafE family protein, partial [Desulfobacterales bacterium]|nr:sulfite exporter TauE/SafE family protein [Desulfobacterales bacterium]
MKKSFTCLAVLLTALMLSASSAFAAGTASVSAASYKAGDVVEIKGQIEPGQDLYLTISQKDMFAPKDTDGVHEVKKFKKTVKKGAFDMDTSIPPLYYLITNAPEKFGKVDKKKFGGPSVLLGKGNGIYSTTMFYLKKKFNDVDADARAMMGPITSDKQWNFLRWANENNYGINTIVKEGNRIGKVVIFSRTVITDEASGNYWDKGTKVNLDKATGQYTVSFKSFRHTPPETEFDVYVNGAKTSEYKIEKNGFWLSKAYRYMNPLWIVIGAILVGTYFSMIGAAGGMLMAAFQVLVVNTMGPVGINAANVLKPSNMALTLFSPLGSFYRYAMVEKRVAWPVGLSFGVGIFIGSIWLGKYVFAVLPMKAYKEWLAILVVIMGI